MIRLVAATALIVALGCSTVYASRVEVGAQPPTEPAKYIALPDVIEVIDELHEEPEEIWESPGVWKITAYCPLECCNGKAEPGQQHQVLRWLLETQLQQDAYRMAQN